MPEKIQLWIECKHRTIGGIDVGEGHYGCKHSKVLEAAKAAKKNYSEIGGFNIYKISSTPEGVDVVEFYPDNRFADYSGFFEIYIDLLNVLHSKLDKMPQSEFEKLDEAKKEINDMKLDILERALSGCTHCRYYEHQ